MTYKFRERGYSVDMLVDFSIGSDLKDSENRIIYLDQPGLGLSKEFLDEGMDNDYVKKYYEYMQNVSYQKNCLRISRIMDANLYFLTILINCHLS